MNRRRFLEQGLIASCGTLVTLACGQAQAHSPLLADSHTRILDAHIHLFDPTRPGGIPWPTPEDSIYKPSLPARYAALAQPLGVVGAIAIEASPLSADNDWLLRIVEASPVMVGMIGDLVPTANDFSAQLDRLHKSPLFLGIRQGNLWNRSLADDVNNPQFWAAMHQLAQARLVLESANPDLPLLEALVKVVERIPELTVVIDHLPHMQEPSAIEDHQRFTKVLAHLGQAPRCFAKLSEIPRLSEGRAITDLSAYRERLDRLWSAFGPEKLIFGSDWPNSDHVATFPETLQLVHQYMADKSRHEREMLFFSNSRSAYRWQSRCAGQA